jgi:hypothetical protein
LQTFAGHRGSTFGRALADGGECERFSLFTSSAISAFPLVSQPDFAAAEVATCRVSGCAAPAVQFAVRRHIPSGKLNGQYIFVWASFLRQHLYSTRPRQGEDKMPCHLLQSCDDSMR